MFTTPMNEQPNGVFSSTLVELPNLFFSFARRADAGVMAFIVGDSASPTSTGSRKLGIWILGLAKYCRFD